MANGKKGAGRKENGNVVVDLGEDIDKKLREAVKQARREDTDKVKMAGPYRPGMFSGGFRPGGFRPGMNRPALGNQGSSFRPWYADRESRMSGISIGAGIGNFRQAKTMDLLTGAGIGLVGNRALVRILPALIGSSNALVVNGLTFVVGLVPALFVQNSIVLGVALPGAVYFAGNMVDWALDKLGIQRPAMAGGAARTPNAGVDAALAARQRLADMRSRVNPAQAPQQSVPRTYATAR